MPEPADRPPCLRDRIAAAVLCVACCNVLPCPTLAALDAEQPKETP